MSLSRSSLDCKYYFPKTVKIVIIMTALHVTLNKYMYEYDVETDVWQINLYFVRSKCYMPHLQVTYCTPLAQLLVS